VTTSANPVLRILVITEDEPLGEIVAAMLRAADYESDAVSEQKAILRVLKKVEDYKLLFCQVAALEEEERLLTWALGAGRDMPIVACAARSREHIPKVIYERCIFLQVPFDREQLLNIVREALKL
jgi:DNA-binding NtrC family response regulator